MEFHWSQSKIIPRNYPTWRKNNYWGLGREQYHHQGMVFDTNGTPYYVLCNCVSHYNNNIIIHAVVKILYIALTGTPRRVKLRSVDTSTQIAGDIISTLTIPNTSDNYTSYDNVLAYRPNHSSNSGGNTAIIFVNLEAAIPCYQYNQIGPVCHLLTREEDSFQFGKSFVQASDIGNHFQIFSNNQFIATYGFGVSGCSTFDQACVSDFEASLVCLLPPARNQCGIWNWRTRESLP